MTITHHPSDATLAAFARGALDEARTLVVASHVAQCAHCRKAVRMFEGMAGSGLAAAKPAPMRPDALQAALARLSAPEAPQTAEHPLQGAGSAAPSPLSLYPLGPWRRIGRGVFWRRVPIEPGPGESRAFMLKAMPGVRIPHHRHSGTEWTCVLEGAFRHAHGRFGAHDFDEADDTVEHHPLIEDGPPCVCLVALSGHVAFSGWLGRLLQPLVRI